MKELIIKTLSRVGVSLIVKEIYIDSYLRYMRIDFMDKYNRYCIFDILYNETDFFTENLTLIGEGKEINLTDLIRKRVRVVGNFNDYKNYNYSVPSLDELNSYLESGINRIVDKLMDIKVKDFYIRKVDFYTTPSLMIFIHFNYRGKRQKVMKIFLGEKINYNSDLDVTCLVNKIKEVLEIE